MALSNPPTELGNVSGFQYGPAFDAVDIGIVVLDGDRRIVGWNDWIARVSRQPPGAAVGRSLYEIFPDVRGTRLQSAIDDTFDVGSSSILSHSLNTLLPLTGDNGHPLLHNVVVRPISSDAAKFCLIQVSDVTVAAGRERVLRERQNARYHRSEERR